MKIDDFKKLKERLCKQKKKNDENIEMYDARVKLLECSKLDSKIIVSFGLSMVPYFILTLGTVILSDTFAAWLIANSIPAFCVPVAIIGSSLCIGAIMRKIWDKKFEIEERVVGFSKAKTEAERLEEQVSYQIELNKINNRNKVIQNSIESLNSDEENLRKVSSKYKITEIEQLNTKEEIEKRIDSFSLELEQKYKELDLLSTKVILADVFWSFSLKSQKMVEASSFLGIGGLMLMVLMGTTLISLDGLAYSSVLEKFLLVFGPFIVGTLGGGAYYIKRNKNREKVFNNLNSMLGENALSKDVKDFSLEEIKVIIESNISDISLVELQLYEQQCALESVIMKEDNISKEGHNDKEWSNLFVTDEDVRLALAPDEFDVALSQFCSNNNKDQGKGYALIKKKKNIHTDNSN